MCCSLPSSFSGSTKPQPSKTGITFPRDIHHETFPAPGQAIAGNHLHLQYFQLELRPHLNLCKPPKTPPNLFPPNSSERFHNAHHSRRKILYSGDVRNIFKFVPILFKAVSLLPRQSRAGPSLCTILHPQAPLLSCVISADAAIEALGGIFTIVLSPGASSSHCSHLQIRINSYKIIHHFAHFAPELQGLDWSGVFFFLFVAFFFFNELETCDE